MKYVLTGHKGLIGSSLKQRLDKEGDSPVLLIDTRDGTDIRELEDKKLTEQADICYHLASLCKVNKTIKDPRAAFDHNVLGTFSVLEFCRKNRIPKLVFTSSSRVLSPEKNPYTASKLYGEELVKGYAQAYGLEYVIIRPSTVYGPFDDKTARLVDIYIRAALKNKELPIYGDESKTLDFTYIDDFIDGFLIAAKQKNFECNIANDEEVKVSEVADYIISLAGAGKKTFHDPEIAQPQRVKVDISALANLGYRPKVSLHEGLKMTFDWYKKNII